MKGLKVLLAALVASLALSACGKKDKGGGGGGGEVAVAPNTCLNQPYQISHTMVPGQTPSGHFVDPRTGQQINCANPYGNFNIHAPYNIWGQTGGGCSIWSYYFPGNYYYPTYVNGYLVCMNANAYSQNISGFSALYGQYGSYPRYTCQWGVNCSSTCVGGTAGISGGFFYLGGTLGYCW